MKPPVFNYADYDAAIKQYEETANLLSDVLRDNARLKAENEALKAQIKAMTDDIRQCPICITCFTCKYWDNERNNFSEKCMNCGWYPWNDEEKVPCIWEWRG